jgi:uncharacterized membrane protein
MRNLVIKQKALGLVLGVLLVFGINIGLAPQLASAQSSQAAKQACAGLNVGGDVDCSTPGTGNTASNLVKTAVDLFSFVVGVIAVIMLIVGGLRFVTSSGDGNSTSAARNTIIYAVIGLIVVALAQVIVRFTLKKTGEAATAPASPVGTP